LSSYFQAHGGRKACIARLLKDAEYGETSLLKTLRHDGVELDDLVDDLGRNYLHIAASAGKNLAVTVAVRCGMNVWQTRIVVSFIIEANIFTRRYLKEP
jgi:hypothetical protein